MEGAARPAGAPPQGQVGSATEAFTLGVTSFSGFGDIGDPTRFVRLPPDWSIGVADVVGSTEAIAAGRYKVVNTAGAAVVSAVSNALGTLNFPFIFAGDGASFAVAAGDTPAATEALAATVAWVGTTLGLRLRGAVLPVSTIRARGLDVQVARFAASADATYAMFSGGGLAWAEQELKSGRIGLKPAPPGTQPDLSGLSCRFRDIRSKNGVILSMLVRPIVPADALRFRRLTADLLAIAEDVPEAGRPRPVFDRLGGIDLASLPLNARVGAARPGSPLRAWARAVADFVVAAAFLTVRADAGSFSARRYLREVVANSDFRKYDDGLMMTLDCGPSVADAMAQRLATAEREGVAAFGLHRQRAATVTCVVPSATSSHHVHFIDGAAGGYAMAAIDLKSRLACTPVL